MISFIGCSRWTETVFGALLRYGIPELSPLPTRGLEGRATTMAALTAPAWRSAFGKPDVLKIGAVRRAGRHESKSAPKK
jgi:hypothetical protein